MGFKIKAHSETANQYAQHWHEHEVVIEAINPANDVTVFDVTIGVGDAFDAVTIANSINRAIEGSAEHYSMLMRKLEDWPVADRGAVVALVNNALESGNE